MFFLIKTFSFLRILDKAKGEQFWESVIRVSLSSDYFTFKLITQNIATLNFYLYSIIKRIRRTAREEIWQKMFSNYRSNTMISGHWATINFYVHIIVKYLHFSTTSYLNRKHNFLNKSVITSLYF